MTEQQQEEKRLKALWSKRKTETPFPAFQLWLSSQDKKCFYCGITEEKIKSLLESKRLTTKRIGTRGKRLELDRKQSELSYDNLDNIVLSCYWCNNAKTDTFTHEEFVEVGKVFSKIWQQRLTR